MKRNWLMILIVAIVIIGMVTAIFIYNKKTNDKNSNMESTINKISEKVTDECTEEWQELQEQASQNVLQTNSDEPKASPNCMVTLQKYYKKCEHLINEHIDIPNNLVNKTEAEIQNNYENWQMKEFSPTQITLYREYDTECGEHYIVRNKDGKIAIYRINENNEEELYEETEIAIDYLTETDKVNIQNGIRVNGNENLNQLIEDFE